MTRFTRNAEPDDIPIVLSFGVYGEALDDSNVDFQEFMAMLFTAQLLSEVMNIFNFRAYRSDGKAGLHYFLRGWRR
jgi:hypothetical protein